MKITFTTGLLLFLFPLYGQQNSNAYPTYVIKEIMLTDSTTLHWETVREGQQLPFIIEQYLWGRWRKVGEVMGKGGEDRNTYDATILLSCGLNYFRVTQYDGHARPRTSPAVKKYNSEDSATYILRNDSILFSRKVHYQLYQEESFFVEGQSDKIFIGDLPGGTYMLAYDQRKAKILLD